MSYCVNCGVKLAASEKSCPLCHIEVINPAERKKQAEHPYPDNIEPLGENKFDRRGFAMLFAILLMIPALITLTINLLVNKTVSWSLITAGSLALLFVWFGLPLISKRVKFTLLLCLDIISVFAYLFLIEQITGSGSQWSLRLGLPITAAAGILIVGLQLVFVHKKVPLLTKLALILFSAGFLVFMIELFVTGFKIVSFWSVFVFIPCTMLGLAFLLIESRKNLKEFARRKLFF